MSAWELIRAGGTATLAAPPLLNILYRGLVKAGGAEEAFRLG